jgi:hypothetical protein
MQASVPGHHAKVEHPVEYLKEGESSPAWRTAAAII